MRWPAWLRRGEPSRPARDRFVARGVAVARDEERGLLAWWFAGGAHAGALDVEPGVVHRHGDAPVPGRSGLHASASVLGALLHAQSSVLCRVRLEGPIACAGDQLAATQRTIVACTDAREVLRAFALRWIDRALAEAMEEPGLRDPHEHRRLADAARERAIDADARLRDAQWVLEEGAGRAGGEARARALGEREGARRALAEGRAAAYAHEAAGQLAESHDDIRAIGRAIELVVEAWVAFQPDADAHEHVRAQLDRELEDALREPLSRCTAPREAPLGHVEPTPAPDRGEALLHAIERALAGETGVRGVHPLVLDDSFAAHVSIALRCDSRAAAEQAVAAIEGSDDLAPFFVRAIAVWGSGERAVISSSLGARDETLRPSWRAAVREGLAHPVLSREPDALVRAWLACEPEVMSAAWLTDGVLALRFEGSIDGARELVARIASHHPRACAKVGDAWTATAAARAALGDAFSEESARAVYTRSCGLADPARTLARVGPVRELKPVEPGRAALLRHQPHAAVPVPAPDAVRSCSWVSSVLGLSIAEAWPLGGDAELARRARERGALPVAVVARGKRDLERVVSLANASRELDGHGIGVVVLAHEREDSLTRGDIGLDRRMTDVVEDHLMPALMGCIRRMRSQRALHRAGPLELRELELRWHLARTLSVERAGWIYEGGSQSAVLAVQVRDRGALSQLERSLAEAFPAVRVVQVVSKETITPSSEIAIEHSERAPPSDLLRDGEDATLARAVAEALADPDVFDAPWMLADPPGPFTEPRAPAREHLREPRPTAARPPSLAITRSSASCPRCGVRYDLPPDAPLAQTRCGLCGNACLIPEGEPRKAYAPSSGEPRAYRCPECDRTIRLWPRDLAVHARCPQCSTAIVPLPVEADD